MKTNKQAWEETIEDLTLIVNDINRRNGWHDNDRPFATDIALLHSEVSEAYEAYRNYGFRDATDHMGSMCSLPKPEGIGSEMADIFIRLLDTCGRYNINLIDETVRKLAYNETRGYKHGGKAE